MQKAVKATRSLPSKSTLPALALQPSGAITTGRVTSLTSIPTLPRYSAKVRTSPSPEGPGSFGKIEGLDGSLNTTLLSVFASGRMPSSEGCATSEAEVHSDRSE